MTKLYFSDYDNWSKIEKQCIYEAWVPYVSDRPLNFFIHKDGNEKEGFITDVIEDDTIFAEHKIITTLKRRKVLILTSDELAKDKMFPDVLIAKIISIKPQHKKQEWYKTLLIDKHSLFVHLPEEITGEESYVNLAQVTTIGKKLLIEKKYLLPEDRMQLVEQRHTECINLGVIKPESETAVNE